MHTRQTKYGSPLHSKSIIIGNLIFVVSNDGFLHVIEKNDGNIIRITDLFKNYKINKRKDIYPIGFAIGNKNLYLTNIKIITNKKPIANAIIPALIES